jgi:hypothetical protein
MEKKPEARPGSLDVSHDASVTWRYLAPAGHSLEMCQQPSYWKSVVKEAGQQRVLGRHAWNRIEIIAEDGTWEAELRVLSVVDGPSALVNTRLIREWHAPVKAGRKPAVPEGYIVEHITNNGWRARDPGGQIIAANLSIEDEAIRAAANHAKKAAA